LMPLTPICDFPSLPALSPNQPHSFRYITRDFRYEVSPLFY
jgi:hypothetical protein